MPEHNILMEKVGHVKGKDVNGNIVTLERTHPRQLALFQTFVSDEDRYSNTIELYDAVPKYFSNPKLMVSLRKDGQFLLALKREFEHRGERYTLYIRPARIIYKNGDERGHDINSVDLVESLKICNLTNISIQTANGKVLIQSPIFPTLLIASREDWLAEPKQAKCYVQFNPLVTACINRITYRQFDYILYMTYKHRLSRWLYKRLAHNYVQAGVLTPYTIKLSTILRDSGTHQSERGKDNRKRVEEALEELQEKRVLIRYETEILRGKRAKVLDAKYVLYPDMDFITEVKKSNSRALKLDEIQSKWVSLPE